MTETERRHHDEQTALRLADQFGLSLPELADRLLYDLCHGLPAQYADHALRIFHAAQRLLDIPTQEGVLS